MIRNVLVVLAVLVRTAWAQGDQVVFNDALINGWQNWSWATVNPANSSPVHSGTRSISVIAGAWQAIYLHHDAFDSSGLTDLVFWIHGGSSGGQRLQVQGLLNGTAQSAVSLSPLTANSWQKITISLASLGVANKPNMDGFWIQDQSGSSQPTFYLDDISLTAVPPPSTVNIAVDASQTVRTIDARHFAVNAAVWDAVFDTQTTISLLTEMGNQALRFPGGSLSDEYHWQSNTSGNNTWQWATSFDKFAHVASATAAQVFITVNYGSGTAAEAASWVSYANVTKGLGIKYWEIGNENYGT
jgi:alpha-L-arabinofuranosidase